tara:strand:+ start:1495 stop:1905 length:411 start_codon:yes stop_codon:yes gene_type:complete
MVINKMIKDVLHTVSNVVGEFIEDKDKKNQLETELKKKLIDLDLAQSQANIEQAKHSSLFVAGARPAIMWVCCLGLFANFFILPIAEWIVVMWYPTMKLPSLNSGELMTLTLSLLGLGGMRSFEKTKGIARKNIKE